MLAWFALVVLLASAAPWLLKPQRVQEICSADGDLRHIAAGDGALHTSVAHGLDCALCLPIGGLPPEEARLPARPAPIAGAVVARVVTRLAVATTGAPLPARGPPLFV